MSEIQEGTVITKINETELRLIVEGLSALRELKVKGCSALIEHFEKDLEHFEELRRTSDTSV